MFASYFHFQEQKNKCWPHPTLVNFWDVKVTPLSNPKQLSLSAFKAICSRFGHFSAESDWIIFPGGAHLSAIRAYPVLFFFCCCCCCCFFVCFFSFPSYISGVHYFGVRFLCMWPFFNPTIKVVTFRLRGLCVLGVFLLPAFTRLGHECQDLLSPCDEMHVCTD